jgi:hypothetical protein
MATTILTGSALKQYVAQQSEEAKKDADNACSTEPFASATPVVDSEDALAEFLHSAGNAGTNSGNTTEISPAEILAALSGTQPQAPAAG